jgi:hypothetical protein
MVVPPGAFFMIAILIWIASGIMNRRNKKEAKAGGK